MGHAPQPETDVVAKELLSLANLGAIASFTQFQKLYPEVGRRFSSEEWDYYCTVAVVGSAMLHMRARSECDPILTEEFQIALGRMLNRKLTAGWAAVSDLFGFIERQGLPDIANTITREHLLDERQEMIGAAVGLWLVWNLKRTEPSSEDNVLVSALGRFMFEHYGAVVAQSTCTKASTRN